MPNPCAVRLWASAIYATEAFRSAPLNLQTAMKNFPPWKFYHLQEKKQKEKKTEQVQDRKHMEEPDEEEEPEEEEDNDEEEEKQEERTSQSQSLSLYPKGLWYYPFRIVRWGILTNGALIYDALVLTSGGVVPLNQASALSVALLTMLDEWTSADIRTITSQLSEEKSHVWLTELGYRDLAA